MSGKKRREEPEILEDPASVAPEGCPLVGMDKGKLTPMACSRSDIFDVLSGVRMPHYPELSHDDFPGAEIGETVLEGVVCFTTFGTRAGLDCDCEYLVTKDGQGYFDNHLFRGFWDKTVRVIKT
ncbi:hypothetical protein KKA95_04670, partial [Patescibacteria group bacterium]|nr:hypothetical protein [Patescibacteria group bacterium]